MKENKGFFHFRLKSLSAPQKTNRQSSIGKRPLGLAALIANCALTVSASTFDGSRTTPVHRIPLADETGRKIIATVSDTMPFSARMTCGACHDYEKIHGGTHFKGAGEGRTTEPWIVVEPVNGTQIPAERMELSAWEFTKRFGSHLPGGAVSDPEDKLADPEARWDISGGLEMNCLACHNHSHRQDMTEWAKQIGRENFRWAATAASGLGEVGGMAARLPDWWNIYDGASPDDQTYRVPPTVNYDKSLFDSKHYVWFDIGKPMDRNCLQCHSTHPVTAQRMDVPGDVHAAAGLSCIDCHRNGEDHQMLRGTTETMSCAACHMEDGLAAGQAGAPISRHKGLPPVHFEKLTCTACHSGLKPSDAPQLIRTSRANTLGIYGRAQWYTESPFIVEPVYVRNAEGKIEPRRMMWPAYWADAAGQPIDEAIVAEAAIGVLDTARHVASLLAKFSMAENALGTPLFVANGNTYARNIDGGLDRIGTTDSDEAWLWQTESNLVSTIPDFDVNAEAIDYDAEGAIVAMMDALNPLDIVLSTKGKLFTKDTNGYLVGTNTTLAAGWYTKDGGPLVDPFVVRAVVDTAGGKQSFNEEQVARMLPKLGDGASYIANGRKFSLSGGELIAEDSEAAEPVSWAFGHDVRGTAQSLGAKTCKECHSDGAPFLFGNVTATGPLMTDRAKTVPMHAFEQVDENFNRLFGMTFQVRKSFKTAMALFAMLLALIALAFGLPAIYRLGSRMDEKDLPIKPIRIVLIVALLVLGITGFLFGWPVSYPLNGFPLLSHVGFGAIYAIALTAWALLRIKSGGNFWFWVLLLSGVVLILSVLVAMFPILGTHGQHLAIVVHRVAAVFSIVAAVLGGIAAQKNNM